MARILIGNVKGPKGEQGEPGKQGIQGIQGIPGEKGDPGTSMTASQAFIAAHPVGSLFAWTKNTNPGTVYGGTWEQRPSLGAYVWERTK